MAANLYPVPPTEQTEMKRTCGKPSQVSQGDPATRRVTLQQIVVAEFLRTGKDIPSDFVQKAMVPVWDRILWPIPEEDLDRAYDAAVAAFTNQGLIPQALILQAYRSSQSAKPTEQPAPKGEQISALDFLAAVEAEGDNVLTEGARKLCAILYGKPKLQGFKSIGAVARGEA